MSKKDYQAIARAIYNSNQAYIHHPLSFPEGPLRLLSTVLAELFAADNPRFDRERFVEACETGSTRGMKK